MVLSQEGQTYRYRDKVFTVGGMVWSHSAAHYGKFGAVKEIIKMNPHSSMANCEFEGARKECLELRELEPVSQTIPKKIESQYILYYYYNGNGGTLTKALGVSTDKSVLLHLMLEDMKETPDVSLTDFVRNTTEDVLRFVFENDAPNDPTYVEYTIAPTPVYPESKGDTV